MGNLGVSRLILSYFKPNHLTKEEERFVSPAMSFSELSPRWLTGFSLSEIFHLLTLKIPHPRNLLNPRELRQSLPISTFHWVSTVCQTLDWVLYAQYCTYPCQNMRGRYDYLHCTKWGSPVRVIMSLAPSHTANMGWPRDSGVFSAESVLSPAPGSTSQHTQNILVKRRGRWLLN